MTIDMTRWSEAYLAELDRASLALSPDRRAELREQISDHLAVELAGATTDEQARDVLERLGDPADLVAEAAADQPVPADVSASARPSAAARGAGPSAGEIAALLLLGVGGVALPLIAPAIGVLFMRSTPRWTAAHVRGAWLILSVGLLAVLLGVGLATIPNPPAIAGVVALILIAVIAAVGPVAALYAATRPRP